MQATASASLLVVHPGLTRRAVAQRSWRAPRRTNLSNQDAQCRLLGQSQVLAGISLQRPTYPAFAWARGSCAHKSRGLPSDSGGGCPPRISELCPKTGQETPFFGGHSFSRLLRMEIGKGDDARRGETGQRYAQGPLLTDFWLASRLDREEGRHRNGAEPFEVGLRRIGTYT